MSVGSFKIPRMVGFNKRVFGRVLLDRGTLTRRHRRFISWLFACRIQLPKWGTDNGLIILGTMIDRHWVARSFQWFVPPTMHDHVSMSRRARRCMFCLFRRQRDCMSDSLNPRDEYIFRISIGLNNIQSRFSVYDRVDTQSIR